MDLGFGGWTTGEMDLHQLRVKSQTLRNACLSVQEIVAGQLRGNCMGKGLSSKKAYLASHVICNRVLPRFIVPLIPSWVLQM